MEKTVEYSKFPKAHKIANIPIVKKQSPTLLVKNADKELWLAGILVYQKLTNKYEQTPTPSQPTNINR
jgi:hypothetical protein